MASKKKAAAEPAAEDTRERRAARPGDPSYQEPAFASIEETAVLDKGPEARSKAVLADIKRMHGG